jgi:hypothetical protein
MLAELERELPTLFDASRREPSLDDVLVAVWERLAAHQTVNCIVCGGTMEPEYGAHALPIGGRCPACGSSVT